MKTLTVFSAGMLIAGPVLALSGKVPVSAEVRQACEMMHNGMKMPGMMVKGDDGAMTCRMMDNSQTHKGTMDHSKMDHGERSCDARYPNNRITKDATATHPIESQIVTPCAAIYRKG